VVAFIHAVVIVPSPVVVTRLRIGEESTPVFCDP
jgi:hypothetical protein